MIPDRNIKGMSLMRWMTAGPSQLPLSLTTQYEQSLTKAFKL